MRTLARAVAALALAAAGAVLPAAPSAAATCGGGPGVTVVIDRASLGGGASTGCDGDGGGQGAQKNFSDARVSLGYATINGNPSDFVCRVNGAPSFEDPDYREDCREASPADAYWHLWWSDGRSGQWRSSGVGVGSLTVPAGGSVAFRFSNGDSAPPAVAPPVRSSSAGGGSAPDGASGSGGGSGATPGTPTPSSTPAAPSSPSSPSSPTAPSASASGSPDASGSAGPREGRRADRPPDRSSRVERSRDERGDGERAGGREGDRDRRAARTAAEVGSDTEQGTTLVDDPTEPQAADAAADGLPAWAAPAVLGALVLVGAGVVVVRRVRGAPGGP